MTNEFTEIVNRLARAKNFKDGSFCLITSDPDSDKVVVEVKGEHKDIIQGVGSTLRHILSQVNDKDAEIIKVFITDIITEDEKSRFKSN